LFVQKYPIRGVEFASNYPGVTPKSETT
jgi:hypothetical protein